MSHESFCTDLTLAARIAVIGAGISRLARNHRVTLFESASYADGHTNTVDVTLDGHTHPVDTGASSSSTTAPIPNLIALFAELGVKAHPSDMTFSVSLDEGRLEWAGTSLNTVFAQCRNLFSPTFIGMLLDIMRFNGSAECNLELAASSERCRRRRTQRVCRRALSAERRGVAQRTRICCRGVSACGRRGITWAIAAWTARTRCA